MRMLSAALCGAAALAKIPAPRSSRSIAPIAYMADKQSNEQGALIGARALCVQTRTVKASCSEWGALVGASALRMQKVSLLLQRLLPFRHQALGAAQVL